MDFSAIIKSRSFLFQILKMLVGLACRLKGWGFCGFFCICGFFFQCFQSSTFLRISAVSSFNQREREKCGKNAYKITLTEPQREMRKNCSQKISLTEPQVCEPLNCEGHGQCTLSFFLTSGVLNGNNLA